MVNHRLRPCPSCKSKNVDICSRANTSCNVYVCSGKCEDCGVMGPIAIGEDAAIAAWDTFFADNEMSRHALMHVVACSSKGDTETRLCPDCCRVIENVINSTKIKGSQQP
jgi:hypothetical protein